MPIAWDKYIYIFTMIICLFPVFSVGNNCIQPEQVL